MTLIDKLTQLVRELEEAEADNVGDLPSGQNFRVIGDIVSKNVDSKIVYGWASVVEKDGEPIVDRQGDVIEIEEIQNAAVEFVKNSRVAKERHKGMQKGEIVESLVFSKEVQDVLGIDLGKQGWFIGVEVNDPEILEKVASGELKAFSIGGKAESREPIE